MDLVSLLPGLAQGITRVAVSYPVDFVRTHQQAQNISLKEALAVCKVNSVRNIPSLYKGAAVVFASTGFDRAVQFAVYEACLRKDWPVSVSAAVAGGATLVSSIIAQSVVTKRIINGSSVRGGFNSTIFHAKTTVLSTVPEICRNWLAGTVYLGVYGSLRQRKKYVDNKIPLLDTASNGIISSLCAITIAYPFETIRIRMHANSKEMQPLRSLAQCPMLYRGIGLALARTIPSAGLGMCVYEHVKQILV